MTLDVYDNQAGRSADHDPRPYVGILFECCGVYVRVYRRPDQKFYRGRCPKCLRAVRLRIGREGTDARFFRAH